MAGRRVCVLGLMIIMLMPVCGCLQGLGAFPGELGAVVQGMTAIVKDQGVLDKFASNVQGNIQNPGMESYIRVTTAAGVRLIGVNGELDLTTEGTGTQLPAGVREALIDSLKNASDEQRAAIFTALGWNRVESPHNPPP